MSARRVFRPLFIGAAASVLLGSAALCSAATISPLSLVPEDAATVGMVRFSILRASPLAEDLFSRTDHMTVDGDAARFMKEAGVDPKRDLDSVLLCFSPTPRASNSDVLVVFEGRFDVDRLVSAVENRGGVRKTTPQGVYFELPEKDGRDHDREGDRPGAVAFVDRHLVLAGPEKSVEAALSRLAAGGSRFAATPLGRSAEKIDKRAAAWVVADPSRAWSGRREDHGGGAPAGVLAAFRTVSLLSMSARLSGDALEFEAAGVAPDEDTRDLLEDTLRGLTAAWRIAVQDKRPDLVPVIRKFEVRHRDKEVSISGSIPGSLLRELADRSRSHST
jgi:hypothetical protein